MKRIKTRGTRGVHKDDQRREQADGESLMIWLWKAAWEWIRGSSALMKKLRCTQLLSELGWYRGKKNFIVPMTGTVFLL